MPAKSETQQRLFGMALAIKRDKGKHVDSDKAKRLAKSLSAKVLKDFAATKHTGLPEKAAAFLMKTAFRGPATPLASTGLLSLAGYVNR